MTRESKKCIVCDTEFFRQKNYTDYSWDKKVSCDEDCKVELSWIKRIARSGHLPKLLALCQEK